MAQKLIFTATEARQNFFKLLRMVEQGQEPVIIKKETDLQARLVLDRPKKKKSLKEVRKLLKEMGEIGLKSGTWEEAKKIISTMHDPHV